MNDDNLQMGFDFAPGISEHNPDVVSAKRDAAYHALVNSPTYTVQPWFKRFELLHSKHGFEWRHAALIAWLSMPKGERFPKTKQALSIDVLGVGRGRAGKYLSKYPHFQILAGQMQNDASEGAIRRYLSELKKSDT